MFAQNSHPPRPVHTKFVVHKSAEYLEIHPPAASTFTLKKKIFHGLIPFKTRLLIAIVGITLLSIAFWISYILLGFNPFMIFSFILLLFLLTFLFDFPKSMHLYFDARGDRFEIRQRSIEPNAHREKVKQRDKISAIQFVTIFEEYQANYCSKRTITIQAQQTYYLDWNLTRAEGGWLVDEIQSWLALRHP